MLLKRSISLLTPLPRTNAHLYNLIRYTFASSSKSFYQILGVPQSASRAEIKSAYYKLAKQYHPDVSKGNEDRFKEISSAYDTLSDDSKRKNYDDTLKYSSASSNTSYGDSQQSGYGGYSGYNAYSNKQKQQQQQYQQYQHTNYSQNNKYYEYDPEYDDPRYSQGYHEEYTSQRKYKENQGQNRYYDPFSWDFRRRFYDDFESAQSKDYHAYEKAEEERMNKAEEEFQQAMHQVMSDIRRKLITIIVACIGLVVLLKIAFGGRRRPIKQEHVVYDQKNGVLYVTDEKTYNQWANSFQPENYPFEKDRRFVRQNINFRPPSVAPYNHPPPVWDNNRIRDERNGLTGAAPPPQNRP